MRYRVEEGSVTEVSLTMDRRFAEGLYAEFVIQMGKKNREDKVCMSIIKV